MKKLITLLFELLSVTVSVAQLPEFSGIYMLPEEQQKEAMLNIRQAKSASISGWFFCVSGIAFASLGTMMVIDSEKENGGNNQSSVHQTGTAFVFAGAATIGFSFRLFRSAQSKKSRVNYMISQNRKAVLSPAYAPVSHTAAVRLVIPM